MLNKLVQRTRNEDEGFTLIELMVVVLIIAILIAIAIPTFLGARERAQERAAQSNVRNAYTAAKTVYTDTQSWSSVEPGAVQASEPSLNLATDVDGTATFHATSTDPNQIAIVSSDATADWVVLAVATANNKCFLVGEQVSAGGLTGTPGTYYAETAVSDGNACTATATPAGGWLDRWGGTAVGG